MFLSLLSFGNMVFCCLVVLLGMVQNTRYGYGLLIEYKEWLWFAMAREHLVFFLVFLQYLDHFAF